MDIKDTKRDELTESLERDAELVRLAEKIKQSAPRETEPNTNFVQNLRKRLVNEHGTVFAEDEKNQAQLEEGTKGLLDKPKKKRRLAFVLAPVMAVILLAVYTSFALASPGFYEKYVPKPLKDALQSADLVKTGELNITTAPGGATVYINNQDKGITPLKISEIREGEHNLRIELENYETLEERITVEPDQISELDFSLTYTEPSETYAKKNKNTDSDQIQKPFRSQFLFTKPDGIYMTSVVGDTVMPIATFDGEIASAAVSPNNHIFAATNKEGKYTILKLEKNKQTTLAQSVGEISNLEVNSDVTYLAYNNGSGLVVMDLENNSERNVEAGSDIKPIKITGKNVYFTQGNKLRRALLAETDEEDSSDDEGDAVAAVSDVVDALDIKIDPSGKQALYQTAEGLIHLSLESEEAKNISTEKLADFYWAGETEVFVEIGEGFKLLDINTGELKDSIAQVKQVPEIISIDNNGRTIALISDSGNIVIKDLDRENKAQVDASQDVVELLGWVKAGGLSTQGEFQVPEVQADEFKGSLELPQADYEDIVIKGDYAYRVSNGKNGLEVISLKNKPEVITTLPKVDFTKEINAVISGDKLIATGGVMQVIDISDPKEPQQLRLAESGNFENVTATGGKVYVAAADKLYIYNNSDLSKAIEEIDLAGAKLDLEAQGSRLYVAAGDDGYHVIDTSEPKVLSSVAEKFIDEIILSNNHAYLFTGNPGSQGEVDVYDLNSFTKQKTISPAFAEGEIAFGGDKAYTIYPQIAVYNTANSEVVLLKEVRNNGIINSVGDVDVNGGRIVSLNDNTLNVFVF